MITINELVQNASVNKMLIITFHNDSSGTFDEGNYDYTVYVNHDVIATGRVENHKRSKGWQGLIKKLAKEVKIPSKKEEFYG